MLHGFGIAGGWAIATLVFRGLLGLGLLTLLVLFIIWIIRAIRRGPMGMMSMHHFHDPLQIAKERYAKGEISQAEYKKLVNDLKD
jgi:putative membrane protein